MIGSSDDGVQGLASGDVAERALAEIAVQSIVQREKSKRFLMGAVCALVIAGIVAVLYAPPGKDVLGYWFGATVIVLALGAIGASRFLLKIPGVSINTQQRTVKLDDEANSKQKD
jgi:hypothetical protein